MDWLTTWIIDAFGSLLEGNDELDKHEIYFIELVANDSCVQLDRNHLIPGNIRLAGRHNNNDLLWIVHFSKEALVFGF